MNAVLLIGMPGGAELIVLLFVMLLMFGGTRLPQLAKGLGQSIKEFKKGVAQSEDADEIEGPARRQMPFRAAGIEAEAGKVDERITAGHAAG